MLPNRIEILEKIGEFFLKENNVDYEATRKFLLSMQVTDIQIESPQKIIITLKRPGFLIGKGGTTKTGLEDHLGMKIQIVEDRKETLYDHLLPYHYRELMSDITDDF